MKNKMYLLRGFIILLLFSLTQINNVDAQRSAGDVGIGAQLGQPTGITVKFYNPGTSVDLLGAWDLDEFLFLNGHLIWDEHLGTSNFHFFYGPGAFIGIRDFADDASTTDFGVSANIGFDVILNNFEIYLQATPRLSLEDTDRFNIGGGLGLRFYL